MENSDALPTAPAGDASPLDRLEAMLSADDAPEEAKEPQNEVEADVPATDPTPEGADPQEEETPEYQLADVAKMLGTEESMLDVDEDGAIVVKTKIDGVEGKAKFSDLLKDHQLKGYAEKQVREASEFKKAALEEVAGLRQQLQVEQAVVGLIAQKSAAEAEYASLRAVDIYALSDSDPVQAQKVQIRLQQLRDQHAGLDAQINQAKSHIQTQTLAQIEASLPQERQALVKLIPEWSDTKVAQEEGSKTAKFLIEKMGYSKRDVLPDTDANGRPISFGLTDHRAAFIANCARLYLEGKVATNAVEKQVRAAPKIIKPGSTQSAGRNLNAIQKAKQEVRSTGSRESIAHYLLQSGKV